jgi:serine protease Do
MRTTDDMQHDLEGVAESLRRVTVVVGSDAAGGGRGGRRAASGQGSGIIWGADGSVVTNAHVAVGDAARITLPDGRSTRAAVVARSERTDLALLRAEPLAAGIAMWPVPVLGEPRALRVGELVVALGHPLGVEHSLTLGVVHAAPDLRRSPYLVADIRLAPGNSGGPLADARGRIVGINSMIVGGLGVAISIDAVRRLAESVVPRPTLGVELRPVRVRIPSGAAEASVALLVLTAVPDGAAARAGIMQGDVLLGHAGRPFGAPEDLGRLLHDAGAGGTVRLDVGRGGRRMSCTVQLDQTVSGSRRAA